MNRLILFSFLILVNPFEGISIDLQTAINQNKVTAVFKSNRGHRGKCIELTLKNNTAQDQKIEIIPGTYLANTDTNAQDIIVVDNSVIALKRNATLTNELNGLCCKRTKSAPSKGVLFAMKKDINPIIQQLANLLIETNEFEYAGQGAMWNLVDNGDPNEIDGSDSTKTMKLRAFVGSALKKEVKPFIWTSYSKPAIVISNQLSIKTEGNHYVRNVNANDIVEYAIYNEADSAISTINTDRVVENQFHKHNVKWNIALENLNPQDKFYFKIKVNGVVQKEWLYYFWG